MEEVVHRWLRNRLSYRFSNLWLFRPWRIFVLHRLVSFMTRFKVLQDLWFNSRVLRIFQGLDLRISMCILRVANPMFRMILSILSSISSNRPLSINNSISRDSIVHRPWSHYTTNDLRFSYHWNKLITLSKRSKNLHLDFIEFRVINRLSTPM